MVPVINALTYAVFFLCAFGQLGRISFLGQQVNVYVYELVLCIELVLLFFRYRMDPARVYFRKSKYILIFLLVLLLSFIYEIHRYTFWENFVGFLYWVRLLFYYTSGVYIFYHLKKSLPFRKTVRMGFTLMVDLVLSFSFIQYFLYPDLRNLYYDGWDPHLYRIFGTFFDTYIAGTIYCILFFLSLFRGDAIYKDRRIKYAALGLLFICVLLSFSRTIYLTFLLTLSFYFFRQKRATLLIVFVAVFILGIFIIPKPSGEGVNLTRIYSIVTRTEDYSNAVKLWVKKPLLGYGYNRIRYAKADSEFISQDNLESSHSGASFHSTYMVALVSAGIIGLLAFIGMVVTSMQRMGDLKYIIIFLLLQSIGDNVLLHPFILFFLAVPILWVSLLSDT
ncbi:hypothetical protein COT62_00130 [Candidatus Roizmanbacteria bacterium CG09_land_8_20_14_0_10_41_9]|uniref:O-antigen ligase-related domain-containing protein n=1 Tax=Candidatus Roizmanbacteria bacterium CG09_land_8_20_14_0_10_41_9 TaxID=1974850 RepID=A0A2H0WU17_9BACT|nr:MAG: hypothetical protein COT62_00130 [Candidatus Roizmanbacteria bacterium CG09_land_8_20_14_0_10_41_9]